MRLRRASVAFPAILLTVACSSVAADPSSTACRRAATNQAATETEWARQIELHSAAHSAGEEHSDDELFGARVDMLIAEAETRRQCG